MKSVFKLALGLFLRTVLVCMLSFMAIITLGMVGSANGELSPVVSVIFGLIYFFMLLYFSNVLKPKNIVFLICKKKKNKNSNIVL